MHGVLVCLMLQERQYSNSIQFNAGGTLKEKFCKKPSEENMEKLANLRRIEDQQEYAVQG